MGVAPADTLLRDVIRQHFEYQESLRTECNRHDITVIGNSGPNQTSKQPRTHRTPHTANRDTSKNSWR